ncbi:MAG TPA: ATP-binding protein [Candidatus Dormibacteraeota bacterium]
MSFVNRDRELTSLERWWSSPNGSLGLVWGRRRVGKTALLQRFAQTRRSVFHAATGRPAAQELQVLSRAAAPALAAGLRDLNTSPFASWDHAFESLGAAAESEPLLVVFDEFPELVMGTPELPSLLRALWDRLRSRTHLKILLSGSAVRTVQAMQEYRAPLYGRFDLSLPLHPFWPHEAAMLLPALPPADRALVWALVGGIPLYLEWWDQQRSVEENLSELACQPGGKLLTEGLLVLATEGEMGELGKRVLYAIANGRTRHNEIAEAVGADPTRTLERLVDLRLVERLSPVTEDERQTRRRIYRIADNFLAFWLGMLDRYRAEIDRGIGDTIVPALVRGLDDFAGPRWEEAFRMHLRRLAIDGALGEEIVAVGPFWTAGADPGEIDAVVLAGRERRPVLVGEAKWAQRVDGARIRRGLERKAEALRDAAPGLRHAVCARTTVDNAEDVLAVTAADIFDG